MNGPRCPLATSPRRAQELPRAPMRSRVEAGPALTQGTTVDWRRPRPGGGGARVGVAEPSNLADASRCMLGGTTPERAPCRPRIPGLLDSRPGRPLHRLRGGRRVLRATSRRGAPTPMPAGRRLVGIGVRDLRFCRQHHGSRLCGRVPVHRNAPRYRDPGSTAAPTNEWGARTRPQIAIPPRRTTLPAPRCGVPVRARSGPRVGPGQAGGGPCLVGPAAPKAMRPPLQGAMEPEVGSGELDASQPVHVIDARQELLAQPKQTPNDANRAQPFALELAYAYPPDLAQQDPRGNSRRARARLAGSGATFPFRRRNCTCTWCFPSSTWSEISLCPGAFNPTTSEPKRKQNCQHTTNASAISPRPICQPPGPPDGARGRARGRASRSQSDIVRTFSAVARARNLCGPGGSACRRCHGAHGRRARWPHLPRTEYQGPRIRQGPCVCAEQMQDRTYAL